MHQEEFFLLRFFSSCFSISKKVDFFPNPRGEGSQKIGIFEASGSDILYLTIASASVPFVTMDHYGAVLMIHEEAYSAIGQGPVKESVSLLYKHFLATMNNVMDLTLPPERKVHLLMHVTKAYKSLFDAKKAIHLVNNNEDEDGLEVEFRWVAIPGDAPAKGSKEMFDQEYMLQLEEFGRKMGADPSVWNSKLPQIYSFQD